MTKQCRYWDEAMDESKTAREMRFEPCTRCTWCREVMTSMTEMKDDREYAAKVSK